MEQTDRFRGEAGGEDWKRSAKEHTCMYAEPTDTDNNVMRAGSWGDMGWVERGKGWGEVGDICNSVNSKKSCEFSGLSSLMHIKIILNKTII